MLDGVVERLALDVPHGVKRSPIGRATESVQRNDTGVFQTSCDFSFQRELTTTLVVVTEVGVHELDRHPPVQTFVFTDKHFSQSARTDKLEIANQSTHFKCGQRLAACLFAAR